MKSVAPTNRPVLGLRKVSVSPEFDSPSLTYRNGEFSYDQDPYAAFLVPPAESLTGPLIARLQNTGLFRVVVERDSPLHPDLEMEASVVQLYGDFRNRSRPTAVLEMRFMVFRQDADGAELVFQKQYREEIPLNARTATAVVAGWNEGLNRIVTRLAADLKVNVQ